jgi:uncharacterized membrane protein YccC
VNYSARSAVAAVASYLIASLFRLPEAYWAAVTTLVVTQSAAGTAASVAGRRFLGTALGAVLAVILAGFVRPGVWVVGLGIFLLGLLCPVLGRAHKSLREQFDRSTYRFAGIALSIILLVPRAQPIWVTALHRFLEVSIGILVALGLAFLWPERAENSSPS